MSRNEIIRMATEAGFELADNATDEALNRFRAFAALVAAREREACAQVCVEISADYWMGDAQFEAATRCWSAICARGTP